MFIVLVYLTDTIASEQAPSSLILSKNARQICSSQHEEGIDSTQSLRNATESETTETKAKIIL